MSVILIVVSVLVGCTPVHQDVYINSNRDIGDRIGKDRQKRLSLEKHDSLDIVVVDEAN